MQYNDYEDSEMCEDECQYKIGGYHTAYEGELLNQGYCRLEKKLGWGNFSTVWLIYARDSGNYRAVKIGKSNEKYSVSFKEEGEILEEVQNFSKSQEWTGYVSELHKEHRIKAKHDYIMKFYGSYLHRGPNGVHNCLMLELLGPSLLDVNEAFFIKKQRMSLPFIKKAIRQILIGLVFLHDHCDMVHTDIKPENIIMKLSAKNQKKMIACLKNSKVKPISEKYWEKQKEKLRMKRTREQYDIKKPVYRNIKKRIKNGLKGFREEKIQVEVPQLSVEVFETGSKIDSVNYSEDSDGNSGDDTTDCVESFTWRGMDIRVNSDIVFKVGDLGNVYRCKRHKGSDIQTRQYRAPEVILRAGYDKNVDVFSVGCVMYELLTGEFLFDPDKETGAKNMQHLEQMIGVLGPFDPKFALSGRDSLMYFNTDGSFKMRVDKKRSATKQSISLGLSRIFKYRIEEAKQIEDFMTPMLEPNPAKRLSARECLKSEWLWSS